MSEHTKRAADAGRAVRRPRRLPDLTGVDLRTLRFMDDPELSAAVDRLLWRPQDLADSWVESGGDKVRG